VDRIDAHWSDLSPRLLSYDWARTDITNRIRKFYLGERNYEFVDAEPKQSSSNQPVVHSAPNGTSDATTSTTVPIFPGAHEGIEQMRSINFEEQFKSFTDLFTDRFYAAPMYESVLMQSKHSPVYVYHNAYEGQFSLLDVYTGKTQAPSPGLQKVSNWFKQNILGRKKQAPKHMGKHATITVYSYNYGILEIKLKKT